MTNPSVFESDTSEVRLALELAKTLQADLSPAGLPPSELAALLTLIGAQRGGLVRQRRGGWQPALWTGDAQRLPERLIGQSLDQSQTQIVDSWCVVPLSPVGSTTDAGFAPQYSTALALQLAPADAASVQQSPARGEQFKRSAQLLAAGLQRIEVQTRQSRRIQQLSAVLKAAAEWQRLDDDDALLHKIADTATELLDCERASIFLWDRRRKKLIGRPALGIEGKPLEVDDDAGVVGEVLRSGEAKIWNAGSDDETRVNRKVDQSLAFQTRSLVAVPMSGQRGELIGVFEAINHHRHNVHGQGDDGFDEMDAALLADLATHSAVAIESQRTRRVLTETRDRLVDDAASSAPLIGNHPSIESIRRSAAKVAKTDLTLLILGKNGTGKEVLARHIHYESNRRSGPFIAVNCAALVESLLESELFGHEKGAFTDAHQTHVGKFELAGGGTLFLDEVGDMSPGGQAKLLRVLEEKVVVRVGGSQPIPVDVRVIAATNQPLEELIVQKRFREDLFFRLNVVSLTLPPLSQRGEDVMMLSDHFLKQFCYQIGRQVPVLDASAQAALMNHPWPGNIRELRNTIERICYLCSDDVVTVDDLMISGATANRIGGGRAAMPGPLSDATRVFQVQHINDAIERCGGNMTDAATALGLHRSNLYRKMRQLGMNTGEE